MSEQGADVNKNKMKKIFGIILMVIGVLIVLMSIPGIISPTEFVHPKFGMTQQESFEGHIVAGIVGVVILFSGYLLGRKKKSKKEE